MLLVITVGIYVFNKYSKNLPDYEQLKSYNPPVTTRLYAADGRLLTEYSKEKRIFVPIEIIPKHLINAFVAAEDDTFYENPGIDPFAIIIAAFRNVVSYFRDGTIAGGASTITQQVVKNFLLSNERTLQRKVKEAILAYRITQAFSKQKILELYLNQIYLGSGAYGVAAAAQNYFDKSIDDLTIEEVALLATLPKAPSKLDPRKNIEKAQIRRNWVIDQMLEEGYITSEEAEEAKAKPIVLKSANQDSFDQADYFNDAVKKELIDLYGSDNVFESGIVVRTTVIPRLQAIADASLKKGLEMYDRRHGYRGALGKISISSNKKSEKEDDLPPWLEDLQNFAIDKLYKKNWQKAVVLQVADNNAQIGVEDGQLGMIELEQLKWARKYINVEVIGSEITKAWNVLKAGDVILVEKIEKPDSDGDKQQNQYSLQQIPEVNGGFIALDPHNGRVLAMSGGYIDAVNQFNRSTQARRQPGSVLKTFGYLAALENGMTPATSVIDEPITLDQGPDLPPYTPSNFSEEFYGPTTLRIGLEKSINVTTIRMASQVGLDKISEVISRFGINSHPRPIYSLVLGSTETTLSKLVNAYAMIVNGGKKIEPAIIEKIQDRNGKTIYKRDKRDCPDCLIDTTEDGEQQNYRDIIFPILTDDRNQITDPQTAYQLTYMLEGVIQRGTGVRAKWAINKTLGGKTGTTNNSFDSWFVGFSPDLVAGVYVGFDSPQTLGKYETGASVALPVFIDFMKEALEDTPSTPFRVPNGIKFVKIDRMTGRYPTPSTPKENILFEAFKLDESVEGDFDTIDNEKSNSDDMLIY